mgnify:CR=1 FL=1
MPNIFALLWKSCQIREMAFRVLDGKLQATGELSLFFFYEEESETKKTVWYETTVPVSVAIECQRPRGDAGADRLQIGHLEIEAKADEDGEERVILLDLVLDLDIRIYEETNLSMIEDLYGVTKQADVVRGKGKYRSFWSKYRKNEGERPVFDFAGHAADSADLRKLWRSVRAGDKKAVRRRARKRDGKRADSV